MDGGSCMMGRDIVKTAIGAAWGMAICALIWLLTGCSTHRTVVGDSSRRADTVYRTNVVRDTVLVKDSVLVRVFSAGDTVYKTREVWRWRERVNVRTDTVYRSAVRTDTIRVPVMVERRASWWERTVERPLGNVLAVVTVALLLWLLMKLWAFVWPMMRRENTDV